MYKLLDKLKNNVSKYFPNILPYAMLLIYKIIAGYKITDSAGNGTVKHKTGNTKLCTRLYTKNICLIHIDIFTMNNKKIESAYHKIRHSWHRVFAL